MDDWEVPPSGAALALTENDTLCEVAGAIKADAMDALTRTDPNNASQIARYQGEVSAIESLFRELEARAAGKATSE